MKKKRIRRKQSINLKFISVLTLVGLVLIIISYFDYDGTRIGAGSFEDEKLLKKKSFQPGNSDRDMPSKLSWGRDF